MRLGQEVRCESCNKFLSSESYEEFYKERNEFIFYCCADDLEILCSSCADEKNKEQEKTDIAVRDSHVACWNPRFEKWEVTS